MIAALRRPQFRMLFAALVVSMVGDSSMLLVPAIAMKDLTGSASAAGLAIMFFMLPICAAPAFGWVIDRFRRRTVLVAACVLSAAALTPLLTVDDAGDWWIIYAVSAAMGASYVCVFGSVTALVKDLVPEHLLAGANSAIQTVRQGLRLGGPLLGAALYTLAGIGPVALLNMASFLVAAVVFGLLRVHEELPPRSRFVLWTELTAGVRIIAGTPAVRRSVVAICTLFLAGGVTESAIFAVVGAGLDRPPAFVGVLATVTGAGAILGGLTATRIIARHGELATIGAGTAIYGLALVSMSVPTLPTVIAAAAGTGVAVTFPFIARVTLLQRSTPAHLIGRATTAYDSIGGISQVIAIAGGAMLVSVVSYRILLPALGVPVLAAAVYAWRGKDRVSTRERAGPSLPAARVVRELRGRRRPVRDGPPGRPARVPAAPGPAATEGRDRGGAAR
jgi:MFS family permease